MSIGRKLKNAASGSADGGGGGGAGGYVDDVFSTYLYTGSYDAANGTGQTQDIVNGIDLAGEGGMVWIKNREGANPHTLTDTERGAGKSLRSDSTNAELDEPQALTSFTGDGFSVGTDSAVNQGPWNGAPGKKIASWTFRKAKNFFDVVTWTGDGVAGREIPHNLGVEPGMAIVKCTSDPGPWTVTHVSIPDHYLSLETAASKQSDVKMVATDKTISWTGSDIYYNYAGREYVAYLFAHDDSDESLIKCGSFIASTGAEYDIGFEPQFLLVKSTTSMDDWYIIDTMRGWGADQNSTDEFLMPNKADQALQTTNGFALTSTGFKAFNGGSQQYIYMAIRRPNKPADEFDPDELFAMDGAGLNAPAGGQVFESPFPVDAYLATQPADGTSNYVFDRLRGGGAYLQTDKTDIENKNAYQDKFDRMDGIGTTTAANYTTWQAYMFRRAPGFFDVVTYTGDGQSGREIPHNLGVAPEMMWVKCRNQSMGWVVYHKGMGNDKSMSLNGNSDATSDTYWNNKTPTDVSWETDAHPTTNSVNYTYIAYLFASVPGVSDLGTYSNSGGEVEVDCGFTTGARLVLVKRTDAMGDWMLFDTERGIAIGGSQYLRLNVNSAQLLDSQFEPFAKGFKVKTGGSGAGVSGGTFIYYAIA